jgi:hypothetical protein
MKDEKPKQIVIDSRAWTGDVNADYERDMARQRANQERFESLQKNYPGVMSLGYAILTLTMIPAAAQAYVEHKRLTAFAIAVCGVALAWATLTLARRSLQRMRGR